MTMMILRRVCGRSLRLQKAPSHLEEGEDTRLLSFKIQCMTTIMCCDEDDCDYGQGDNDRISLYICGGYQDLMIMIAIIMSMTLQVHLRRLPRPEGLNCRALGFSLSKCYLAPRVTSRHLMDILMSKMMVI